MMLEFWMYILRCCDGTLYVGHTDDLERRIAQHESGELGGYTALRRPVTLVFCQPFPSREEALARERQVKNWSGGKKEALVARDWNSLSRLARGPDRSHQ
jgi:predicted GIY-YIG superfamily endonuclease